MDLSSCKATGQVLDSWTATGQALDAWTAAGFSHAVRLATFWSRINPKHKRKNQELGFETHRQNAHSKE